MQLFWDLPVVRLELTTTWLTVRCSTNWAKTGINSGSFPTLAGSFPPTTRREEANFCVRHGNRCIPSCYRHHTYENFALSNWGYHCCCGLAMTHCFRGSARWETYGWTLTKRPASRWPLAPVSNRDCFTWLGPSTDWDWSAPCIAALPLPAYLPDHLSGSYFHIGMEISSRGGFTLDAFSVYPSVHSYPAMPRRHKLVTPAGTSIPVLWSGARKTKDSFPR